jgi:hypothetical protein
MEIYPFTQDQPAPASRLRCLTGIPGTEDGVAEELSIVSAAVVLVTQSLLSLRSNAHDTSIYLGKVAGSINPLSFSSALQFRLH